VRAALNVLAGIALVGGFLALWYFGVRLFIWAVFAVSSLVPFIGRRHRHSRWDELNRTEGEGRVAREEQP
jgi:hypothetical protein